MNNERLPIALSVFLPLQQFHQRLGFNQGSVICEIPARNGMFLGTCNVWYMYFICERLDLQVVPIQSSRMFHVCSTSDASVLINKYSDFMLATCISIYLLENGLQRAGSRKFSQWSGWCPARKYLFWYVHHFHSFLCLCLPFDLTFIFSESSSFLLLLFYPLFLLLSLFLWTASLPWPYTSSLGPLIPSSISTSVLEIRLSYYLVPFPGLTLLPLFSDPWPISSSLVSIWIPCRIEGGGFTGYKYLRNITQPIRHLDSYLVVFLQYLFFY